MYYFLLLYLIWGPATYVIPGCIWLLYHFKYNFWCVEVGYMHLPTKVFNYLMRPESRKLDEWGSICYARQERELHFWGIVWSVITLEFLPKRYNKLSTHHWIAFSFPEWGIIGWRWGSFGNLSTFLVFTIYREIYIIWSTFFRVTRATSSIV